MRPTTCSRSQLPRGRMMLGVRLVYEAAFVGSTLFAQSPGVERPSAPAGAMRPRWWADAANRAAGTTRGSGGGSIGSHPREIGIGSPRRDSAASGPGAQSATSAIAENLDPVAVIDLEAQHHQRRRIHTTARGTPRGRSDPTSRAPRRRCVGSRGSPPSSPAPRPFQCSPPICHMAYEPKYQ